MHSKQLSGRTFRVFHDDDSGTSWCVLVVYKGERYGRDLVLVHKDANPLVEFYDTRGELTALGQFVSRYYRSTLLAGAAEAGLNLDGGVPSWQVSGECMARVRRWLHEHVALEASKPVLAE